MVIGDREGSEREGMVMGDREGNEREGDCHGRLRG